MIFNWWPVWYGTIKPAAQGVAYQVKKNAWKVKAFFALILLVIIAYLYRTFLK